jgi:hypothetical protein
MDTKSMYVSYACRVVSSSFPAPFLFLLFFICSIARSPTLALVRHTPHPTIKHLKSSIVLQ